MSELIIIERPKFTTVPVIFADQFEEDVIYAYESLSERNSKYYGNVRCLPALEQFDDDGLIRTLFEKIVSLDMFNDEEFDNFLEDHEVAIFFYEAVADKLCECTHDIWKLLNHFKMSFAINGEEVFNSPIREVW